MRMHAFHRTELIVGQEGFARLQAARCCVIGLGGVGSYAAEALVRAGVGHVTLVDFDAVCLTNVNRQLHATRSTVGQSKAVLMGARARDINPKADVRVIDRFFGPATADEILGDGYDYVLDAIDNVTAKAHLVAECVRREQRVVVALGAGGKLDPTRIQVSDLSQTHTDPFARAVRDLLKPLGIVSGVECVWSDEPAAELDAEVEDAFRCICVNKTDKADFHACERRRVQGTVSWMPAMFGLTMAGVVANRLLDRAIAADRPPRDFLRQAPARGKPSRQRKKELLASVGLDRRPVEPAAE